MMKNIGILCLIFITGILGYWTYKDLKGIKTQDIHIYIKNVNGRNYDCFVFGKHGIDCERVLKTEQ